EGRIPAGHGHVERESVVGRDGERSGLRRQEGRGARERTRRVAPAVRAYLIAPHRLVQLLDDDAVLTGRQCVYAVRAARESDVAGDDAARRSVLGEDVRAEGR